MNAAARVLVVGDSMLDRYWDGSVDRVSPEAPVLVLNVEREFERAGGAANVALNLVDLGSAVTLATLLGRDAAGERLAALLAERGVELAAVGGDALNDDREDPLGGAPPPAAAHRFRAAGAGRRAWARCTSASARCWPTARWWCSPTTPRAAWRGSPS